MQYECYVGHSTADYENYDFYEWLGSGETWRREDGTPRLPTQTCPSVSVQQYLFL